ncbi:MAG TPA: MFS transporter [Thermomicrobiales bacterium]|nr:MFS transporter [Thermomicrobiales bacterium]
MIAALRQRNFALLWVGQLISLIGDWVLFIALPFYVFDLTGSTLATGGMFIALTVPRLALGSVAGVFVDRWDRRRTMLAADFARAGLLLLLLLVRSVDWLWLVYVVALAESAISQFFNPAKSAIIPRLVPDEHLLAANSLNSLSESLTRLVGPALGGLLFGVLGLSSVVYADSVSYAVSGTLIALMTLAATAPAAGEGDTAAHAAATNWRAVWREWRAGLGLVLADRALAVLFLVMGTVMVGEGIVSVLLVVWVKEILHGGATELGWLMTTQAIGGLAGGLLAARLGRAIAPARLIGVGALLTGVFIIAIVSTPTLAADLVLMALIGGPAVVTFVAIETLLQNLTEDRFRGRIFGALGTTMALAQLVGMALAGALGNPLGTLPVLDLTGALYCVGGVLTLALLGGALRESGVGSRESEVGGAQQSAISHQPSEGDLIADSRSLTPEH